MTKIIFEFKKLLNAFRSKLNVKVFTPEEICYIAYFGTNMIDVKVQEYLNYNFYRVFVTQKKPSVNDFIMRYYYFSQIIIDKSGVIIGVGKQLNRQCYSDFIFNMFHDGYENSIETLYHTDFIYGFKYNNNIFIMGIKDEKIKNHFTKLYEQLYENDEDIFHFYYQHPDKSYFSSDSIRKSLSFIKVQRKIFSVPRSEQFDFNKNFYLRTIYEKNIDYETFEPKQISDIEKRNFEIGNVFKYKFGSYEEIMLKNLFINFPKNKELDDNVENNGQYISFSYDGLNSYMSTRDQNIITYENSKRLYRNSQFVICKMLRYIEENTQ